MAPIPCPKPPKHWPKRTYIHANPKAFEQDSAVICLPNDVLIYAQVMNVPPPSGGDPVETQYCVLTREAPDGTMTVIKTLYAIDSYKYAVECGLDDIKKNGKFGNVRLAYKKTNLIVMIQIRTDGVTGSVRLELTGLAQ